MKKIASCSYLLMSKTVIVRLFKQEYGCCEGFIFFITLTPGYLWCCYTKKGVCEMESKLKVLTAKQERFCQEYIIDLNATKAAVRSGYSAKTAKEQGCVNLTKPNIQERIKDLNKSRSKATGITQKRVLEELAKIAFFDIRKIYDVDGAILPMTQIDDAEAAVIAGIKTTEVHQDGMIIGEIKEVKVFDKLRALEALGKHLGIFDADNRQKETRPVIIVKLGSGINPIV